MLNSTSQTRTEDGVNYTTSKVSIDRTTREFEVTFISERRIKPEDVMNLLSSVFETGASSSWIEWKGRGVEPKVTPDEKFTDTDSNDWYPWYCLWPLFEGSVLVHDGDCQLTLDTSAVMRGLRLMSQEQPEHWRDFLDDNADADTADVFLQLALFEEIVYE